MKPLIGITATLRPSDLDGLPSNKHTLRTAYTEAVIAVGGAPVILPLATEETVRATVSRLDGLILSGGADIPSEAFGAVPHPNCNYVPVERWKSECLWLRAAEELGVPVLGICLGMQVINAAGGGTLIQDLPTERPGAQPHAGPGIGVRHEVLVEKDSWLAGAPSLTVMVSSAHHQAVDRLAEGYRVTARAGDGIIEAIEYDGPQFIAGVQWHPERCLEQSNWLINAFVKLAASPHKRRDNPIPDTRYPIPGVRRGD
jgi:putative glutamine amidotransferase